MSPRAGIDSKTVLQTAVSIADSQGAEAVTLSSVAQSLGIRPPSLYNHVKGLGDLRRMLAVYALRQLYETILKAAEGKNGEEAIWSFADAYIRFVRDHPGLYEVVQLAPDPEDMEIREISSLIVNFIVSLLQVYELSEEESIHTVRGLRSLIHGFASLERHGGFGLPLDVQESLNFNLNLILQGLSRRNEMV